VNVFNVEASAFIGAALLSIDAPAGSLAIINIHGASATFTGFSQILSGGINPHGVLFNFVEATAIDAQGYGFWGTVLAPNAHVTFSNGSFDGGLYARSLTGNAAGHINPLTDRDVCLGSEPPNSPPAVAITSPANGASFLAPATINVAATASDSDGTVSKVEFFRDGALVGTATSAPYAVTLTAVPAGTYSLTAKATDDRGASTLSAAVVVTVTSPPPSPPPPPTVGITVTSPFNGASIKGDRVLVKGRIQAPPHAGVTVNDVVAAVDSADNFYAVVPLQEGGNSLLATVTTLDGQTATQTVAVSAEAQATLIEVSAEPTSGLSPLAVTFQITNSSDSDASYTVGSSGPFLVPAQAQSLVTITYPAGIFTPAVVVTEGTGSVVTRPFLIQSLNVSERNAMLQAIWSNIKTSLAAGDIEQALTYFDPSVRDRYRRTLNDIASALPGMFSNFPPIHPTRMTDADAEYFVIQSENGTNYGHYLYFAPGGDGVWRIQDI
jgi:putative adhesin/Big-like domain-containing protein/glucodextranase-like protein